MHERSTVLDGGVRDEDIAEVRQAYPHWAEDTNRSLAFEEQGDTRDQLGSGLDDHDPEPPGSAVAPPPRAQPGVGLEGRRGRTAVNQSLPLLCEPEEGFVLRQAVATERSTTAAARVVPMQIIFDRGAP